MADTKQDRRLDPVDQADPDPSKDLSEKDQDSPRSNSLNFPTEGEKTERIHPDGRRELTENDAYHLLAYSWPAWKRWMLLSSVASIQISMNFNTSVFPNAVQPLSVAFDISEQEARVGQMIYLVMYSFGCELWAPWSEEFGRWPILMLSMFFINIWQLPAALAPNWGSIVVARALVGPLVHARISKTNLYRVVFLPLAVVSHLV